MEEKLPNMTRKLMAGVFVRKGQELTINKEGRVVPRTQGRTFLGIAMNDALRGEDVLIDIQLVYLNRRQRRRIK